jgi:hypothetical protein
MSSGYYAATAVAQQQLAVARAAMLARENQLLEQATSSLARLEAAERAYKEGDVRVASRIYIGLVMKERGSPAAAEARQRLARLAEEARQKLKQIDAKLADQRSMVSPGELSTAGGPATPQQVADRWEELVAEAFQRYDRLAEDYAGIPEVKGELTKHIAKQRRQTEFAAVLNEPEAKTLWEEGQRREQEGQLCCAYWVYKEAAGLTPARSAERARRRLAEMEQDPEIMAAAAVCRELQECHKLYDRAKRLIEARPARAKELFAQIVARAPADSEVYQSALTHLQEIR